MMARSRAVARRMGRRNTKSARTEVFPSGCLTLPAAHFFPRMLRRINAVLCANNR